MPPTPAEGGRLRLAELLSTTYRTRTFSLATLWFTSFFVVYGYLAWLPTMYVSVGQLPPVNSLALTVVLGATQIVIVYATAWLVDRVGRRPMLLAAFSFAAGIILAIGMSISSVTLYLYTSELYPTRMRGWARRAIAPWRSCPADNLVRFRFR